MRIRSLAIALSAPVLIAQVLPKRPQILVDVDLFQAVMADDARALQRALAAGANPNGKEPSGLTPLFFCALHGDGYQLASQLIRAGSRVEGLQIDGARISPATVAVATLNYPLLRVLQQAGADLKQVDEEGRNLLHVAASAPDSEFRAARKAHGRAAETLECLLKIGLPLDGMNRAGFSPLTRALADGQAEIAQALLEHGASIQVRPSTELPPILRAAQLGHPGLLRALLAKGADPKVQDSKGATALSLLTEAPDVAPPELMEAFLVLVQAGLNPRSFPTRRPTLLHRFIENKEANGHVLATVLDAGLDVDALDAAGRSHLCVALSKGQREIVHLLLDRGASLAPRGGKPPLLEATQGRDLDMIRLLLDRGADPDSADPGGQTAAMAAARNGDWQSRSLKLLLEYGADPRRTDAEGQGLLHYAASQNSTGDTVKILLEKGLSVLAADKEGRTPLHVAAEKGAYATLQLLLNDPKAALNGRDVQGRTPLVYATMDNYYGTRVLELLHSRGASLDPPKGELLPTALLEAIEKGHVQNAQWLLSRGADPARVDARGRTPLRLAVEKGQFQIVQEMLRRNGPKDAVLAGELLVLAAQQGQAEVVRLLLDWGGNPNTSRSEDGVTPLLAACQIVSPEIVKLLLVGGAKADALSRDGRTAFMHLGIKNNSPEAGRINNCWEMLQKAGVDIRAKDLNGETALFQALRLGAPGMEMAKGLIAAGLDPKVRDKNGKPPLPPSLLLVLDKPDTCRQWLGMGADPNERIQGQWPILVVALARRNWESARLLIDHGSNIHASDSNEVEPFGYAAAYAPEELLRLLIRKGAHLSHRDKDADTPLGEALFNGNRANVKILIEAGARAGDAFRGDWSAFALLLKDNPQEAVALLRTKDEAERSKGDRALVGIWTYGALAAAVINDDSESLSRAKKLGLDFGILPRKAIPLLELAELIGKRKAAAVLE